MISLVPVILQHYGSSLTCSSCLTKKRQLPDSIPYGDLIDIDLDSYQYGKAKCISCLEKVHSYSVYSPSHNLHIPIRWLSLSTLVVGKILCNRPSIWRLEILSE